MGFHVPGSAAGQRRARSLVAAGRARRGDSAQKGIVRHSLLRSSMRLLGTLLVVAAMGGVAHAQIRGVTADVAPIVGADGVRAGSTVRAALRVTLPAGFHVQSNKPRDPSL